MKSVMLVAILSVILLVAGCVQKADDSGYTKEGVANVVEANNQFAFELYSELGDGNIFFSPYSISNAFAITYEGARGQTANEIQNVLHFPTDENMRRPAFARLYNMINTGSNDYQLSTANALWAQKDYPFLEDYISLAEKRYAAKATNLDFSNSEEASSTINNWVEGQTNGKIKDLVPTSALSRWTKFVITNAIYFKGFWENKFDVKDTTKEDFNTGSGIVKADMMKLWDSDLDFNYTEDDDAQVLELPYKGGDISMIIILPRNMSIEDLEGSLDTEKLQMWKDRFEEHAVRIYIPKFEFETKYFMVDTLKEMGMETPFNATAADFSGMDGTKNLFIGNVIHQAYVAVDEEGTEAAAATAVIMQITGMAPQPIVFRADHPFIFMIQERGTGVILFMGRVVDPTKS